VLEVKQQASHQADIAIIAVEGECHARTNTPLSAAAAAAVSTLATGKPSPLKRTLDLYFD